MNIHQYIRSGIIESYALGLASAEERAEIEQLLPLYPLLKDALSDFEYDLEYFSIQNEVQPPSDSFAKIEERLRELPAVRRTYRRSRGENVHRRSDPAGDYIPVQATSSHIWVHKNWRVVFVIWCLLSKIFLALFIYYYVQYQHAQKDIRQLQEQLARSRPAVR